MKVEKTSRKKEKKKQKSRNTHDITGQGNATWGLNKMFASSSSGFDGAPRSNNKDLLCPNKQK
jgi:hypothetical protein